MFVAYTEEGRGPLASFWKFHPHETVRGWMPTRDQSGKLARNIYQQRVLFYNARLGDGHIRERTKIDDQTSPQQ